MLFHCQTNAQVGNWKHYGLKEGLPATTIYSITQDKKGFIWIATEAGLVRFDGTEFKTFTIKDGLPDNEIISVTCDSLDRVWITPFKKNVCYYKNGKIYTEKNDTLLHSIVNQISTSYNYYVGKHNRVWMSSSNILCISNNQIKKIELPTGNHNIKWIEDVNDNEFIVYTTSKFYKYKNDKLSDSFVVKNLSNYYKSNINVQQDRVYFSIHDTVAVFARNKKGQLNLINRYLLKGSAFSHCVELDNKLYVPTIGFGIYVCDNLKSNKQKFNFIPNHSNSIFKDRDNNLWVATSNNGLLFQHNNSSVLTINSNNGLLNDNVGCIYADSLNNIYIGDGVGALRSYSKGIIKTIAAANNNGQYLKSMKIAAGKGCIAFTSDNYPLLIYNTANNKVNNASTYSTKSLIYSSCRNKFIAGLSSGISFTNAFHPFTTKAINNPYRVTAIAENNKGDLFCGTPEGLYKWKDSFTPLFKDDEILSNRINAIASDAYNVVWVCVSSNYIVAIINDKIIYEFNAWNNSIFCGTICRSMFADNKNNIWVATNNGLNKINYTFNSSTNKIELKSITPYSTIDGLADNNVNDVFVRDSMVYAATAKGVSVFNYLSGTVAIAPPIFITNITINQKDTTINDQYTLSYNQNNISIKYAGISFISDGKISYRYKLIGSDDKWNYTSLNQIELKSLHNGDYTFIVETLDKFGTPSSMTARVSFTIKPAFYNTILFKLLITLFIGIIIYAAILFLFNIKKRKAFARIKIQEEMNMLEQKALRSQMNPHFIFNSLAAIQHYINNEEAKNADKYLTMFSRLIRKTLNNSNEATISIEKEISYLENYILLEQMRFKDKFSYLIICDETIDKTNTYLPTMLLQPFVENAIRHGLMHRENNDGKLVIHFFMKENQLVCTIDDNGIGIIASQQMKTNAHIEYQSKGITISSDRIDTINAINQQKIALTIEDKITLEPLSSGTLITLIIS